MDAFTDSRGFDVENAVEHVCKGGEVVVCLPGDDSELFRTPVVRSEIRIETSYGTHWRNFE